MSEGTYAATWPMCRGPAAYGQATATSIRCAFRFGEVLTLPRLGFGGRNHDTSRLASQCYRCLDSGFHPDGGIRSEWILWPHHPTHPDGEKAPAEDERERRRDG